MYLNVFIVYFNVSQRKLIYFEDVIKSIEGISMYINGFQCIVCKVNIMCTLVEKNPNYYYYSLTSSSALNKF